MDRIRAAAWKLRLFIALTKPRQLALLMLTMYGAYFAAGGSTSLESLALLTVMGFSSIGGVTALNMYFDADIDSIMRRTRRRPLPSGKLSPGEALAGSLVLIAVGAVTAYMINIYVLASVLAGLFFDIVAYTQLTKRFTPLSIVSGSIAGSMPALGGWAAGAGSLSLGGVLLALVVFLWQPIHVWFLAYYFRSDYEAARIPVLPTLEPRQLAALTSVTTLAMPLAVWVFALAYGYGYLSAIISTLLAAAAIVKIMEFSESGDRKKAISIFKFASPIIAVVFVMIPLERVATAAILLS